MPRHIFLFSPVTSGTAEMIIRQLLDFDRESNDEITIFINSPGGSVISLLAILDTMDMVKSSIKTVVLGTAASAAASIAAAGDIRLIAENGEFMIHEVSSFMMGSQSEIEEDVERMNKLADKLISLLAKHTGKSVEKLKSIMKKTNKFFDAKEAVRFGLADKVIKKNEAQLLKLSEGINTEGNEIVYNEEGLSEVQLLREGKFSHPVYGDVVLTDEILLTMVSNFEEEVRGIDISLDYTHDNEGGERPAACWIKKLFVKKIDGVSGLYAGVEFTPKGKTLIKEKEFRYASADFSISYMTESGKHVPYVLRGGTLTNRPFIKEMNPIKLSEYKPKKEETNQMDKEALFNALKGIDIDVQGLIDSAEAQKAEIESLQNQIKELSALPAKSEAEITELKSKLKEATATLTTNEMTSAIDSLIEAGKILPAQKDSILKQFETVEAINEFYKDAPVAVAVKPKGHQEENNDELTESEQKLVDSGDYTAEQIICCRTSEKKAENK